MSKKKKCPIDPEHTPRILLDDEKLFQSVIHTVPLHAQQLDDGLPCTDVD